MGSGADTLEIAPLSNTIPDVNADVWTTTIPAGTESLWTSTRTFTSDGLSPQTADWTDPALLVPSEDTSVYAKIDQDNVFEGTQTFNEVQTITINGTSVQSLLDTITDLEARVSALE